MVVLYVKKSWIDQIGGMAKLLHLRSASDACVSLQAEISQLAIRSCRLN